MQIAGETTKSVTTPRQSSSRVFYKTEGGRPGAGTPLPRRCPHPPAGRFPASSAGQYRRSRRSRRPPSRA